MTDTNNDKGYLAPTDVNQGKFPVDESNLVYTNHHYSLAVSDFDGRGSQVLGMRWNIEGNGFPMSYAHPVWMIIPDPFAIPILSELLNRNETKETAQVDYQKIDKGKVIDAISKIMGKGDKNT